LELIKDYDYNINYHPGKANVVVDALSRKSSSGTMTTMFTARHEIFLDMERVEIEMIDNTCTMLSNLTVKLTILYQIKDTQGEDLNLTKIIKEV
jgi:hypothetical protein